jgi:hypothetical protein
MIVVFILWRLTKMSSNSHFSNIVRGSAIARSGYNYLDTLDSSYRKIKLELGLFWGSELGREIAKMIAFCEAFEGFEASLDKLNDRQSPENLQACKQAFRALEAIADIKRPNL